MNTTAIISGTKWNDLDGDGVRDAGEPGLPGWTVFLDTNQNGNRDSGEPSRITGADGSYSFTGLTPGTYVVAELAQAGWQQTAPSTTDDPLLTITKNTGFWPLNVLGDDFLVGDYYGENVVYQFDGSTGAQVATYAPPPGPGRFGLSVEPVGNNVLIGDYEYRDYYLHGANPAVGIAYLYDGLTQARLLTFHNPNAVGGESHFAFYACTTALGSNLVAIGSPLDNRVYLYDATLPTGSTPEDRLPIATFSNPTAASGDYFGGAVAALGNTILISDINDDSDAPDAGIVYLFDSANPAAPAGVFRNPRGAAGAGDHFGRDISVMGNRVLIGAPGDRFEAYPGAAYLFDGAGNLLQTFENPSPNFGDVFGTFVAMAGENVLVSAVSDDTRGTDSGALYLFDGASGRLLQTYYSNRPGDQLGHDIAMLGNKIIVGAGAGAAYAFWGPGPGTGAGSHIVTVTSGEVVSAIDFGNHRPTADAGGPYAGDEGSDILLNGSGSSDAAAHLLTFEWDFDGDGEFDDATGVSPTFHALDDAAIPVGLRVTDAIGAWSTDTATLTVNNLPPSVTIDDSSFTVVGGPTATLVKKLMAFDGSAGDYFGTDVGLDGDFSIVGADLKNGWEGAAYVFSDDYPDAKLVASDGLGGKRFGNVEISGNYAIAGAHGEGGYRGAVYLFERSGGVWTEVRKITRSDGAPGDGSAFGHAVAIAGDYALVGAESANNERGSLAGAAYVYYRDPTLGWTQQARLVPDDLGPRNWFGGAVALDGDYALIGATGQGSGGAAYVYRRSGTTWTLETKVTAPDSVPGDTFGMSVSLSGDYAVVGESQSYSTQRGKAFVFHRSGSNWDRVAKLTPSDSVAGMAFGYRVAIVGDNIIVSAPDTAPNGPTPGAVYLFTKPAGGWTDATESLRFSAGQNGDCFGCDVSMSGDLVLIGAASDDNARAPDAGAAYLYRLTADRSITVNEGEIATATGTWWDVPADTVTLTASVGEVVQNADHTWSWSCQTTDGPDESGPVTITATDEDGGVTPISFQLIVNNVVPTVDAGPDDTIDEGGTFVGAGSFTDPGADRWTAMVDYGDGSGVLPLPLSGKTFALSHTYADDGLYTVTVKVQDDDMAPNDWREDTLVVTVNNLPPELTVDHPTVTVDEGWTAFNSGTWSDVLADRPHVTLTASVGDVTKNEYGTWNWSFPTTDGPDQTQSVTITASDEAALDFQSMNVAAVAIGKYHDHYLGTRMAAYDGSVFFSIWDAGTGWKDGTDWEGGTDAPSKVLRYTPPSGPTDVAGYHVLAETTGKFTAVETMAGKLYMADSSGNLRTYNGTSLAIVAGTPFSATNYVYGMAEFNGKTYFGTTAGTVYEFDGSTYTPVFQSASWHPTIVDICAWNGSLYVAPWYDNLYKSNGADLTSWQSVITGVCTTANAQMLATPNYLYVGVIDTGGGHSSTVRRTSDGVHFATIAGPGPFKWDYGALWHNETAYFFQNGNAGGPHTSGSLVTDDGLTATTTSMGDWQWRIRSAVELNGEVYAIANVLDMNGGVVQEQHLLTSAHHGSRSSITFDLVVNNVAPTVAAGADATIDEGATFAGAGSFTDPGADIWTATVDYGDGSGVQPLALAGKTFALSHTYADDGVYTVTVKVQDDDMAPNDWREDTLVVTVNNLADLSGRVFDDLDNDGQIDPTEAGIGGVSIRLVGTDDLGVVARTTTTGAGGTYLFMDLRPGSYTLTEDQPAGWLDGIETAGTLGGIVDNTQDCNVIDRILVEVDSPDAPGYNFGEILPSSIQGLVWEDFNNDALVDFGEEAIEDVDVRLTGTDDRGAAVDLIMRTNDQGIVEFINRRPGDYTLTETQPAGYLDGKDVLGTVNGIVTGNATVNDQFSEVVLPRPDSDGVNYNFGERPLTDGQVRSGQTATIGFWQNKNGQNLIKSLNGSEQSTQLAFWLAATFPNMYGSTEYGGINLAGKTNVQVAELYTSLFKRNAKDSPGGPPKLDAQVLAVALAAYVTNEDLAGTTAASYGFLVTEHGLGVSTFDVGDANRAAFGLSATDSTILSVMDILLATNQRSRNGLLYDMDGNGGISSLEQTLRTMANEVYSAINERGHI